MFYNKLKSFLKLCWRISPSYIVLLIVDAIFSGLRIVVNVVLPKYLINELIGNKRVDELIIFGAAIVLSNVFFAFCNNLFKKVMSIKKINISEKMSLTMAEKIMNIDYSYLEDPYYLDLKERAVFAINNRSALENIVNSTANIVKNIVSMLGLVTILFTLSWILVLFLILTIVLSLFIYYSFMKYQQSFFQSLIPINRKYAYYINICLIEKFQKDIRLYNFEPLLIQRIASYNQEFINEFKIYYNKLGKIQGLYSIINNLQASIAYGYVGLKALGKLHAPITIGSFTMYVSAAINFSNTTKELGENITTILQMLDYLDPYMEFVNLPEYQSNSGTLSMKENIKSVSFQNVSFKYPSSDNYVLKNISFDIKYGEKISIVGLNGAGKSTLIKLICRLYAPTSGKILINGKDIYEYEYVSYINKVSAIFQDFKIFAFTIKENITCQDICENSDEIIELINQVGLNEVINNLPMGINSVIGKSYEDKGVELSGGERQKIAIARMLYKDASLIILDEPTSALDPLAEAEIYMNFNNLVKNKTAIYISHRMSSSVFCDRILLIQDGEIVDFDTHTNLMNKKDSLYYKLFTSQAVNYELSNCNG
ncbi:ABC transporter ATP-binding protein [Abyssisolibacter fermentans]|uniref:ABC transporter ATP-binding protein n=1 Tax=Abyssisolibacter fermentans TaxID=1766203 RepID=UPI0008371B58|nr:ABC transporter ATP-binding protein [Abyssisolibacter fermentans]